MQGWMKRVAVVVGCVGLAACAAKPAKGPGVEAAADVKARCATLYGNPAIDPIRDRVLVPIPLDQGQPVEMLANRTHVTEAERPAVLALAKAFEACNEYAVERLGPLPSFRIASNDRVADALGQLLAGEITYGRFARTVLYAGERDQLERQRLEEDVRHRERWRTLLEYNGN